MKKKETLETIVKRTAKARLASSFEDQFLVIWNSMDGITLRKYLALCPEVEYRFHPDRKWRFDFAIPSKSIAIEIEGGTWSGGGHNRGAIYRDNCTKYNEAARLGWRVFRFTTDQIKSGYACWYIYYVITGIKNFTELKSRSRKNKTIVTRKSTEIL